MAGETEAHECDRCNYLQDELERSEERAMAAEDQVAAVKKAIHRLNEIIEEI